MKVGDLVQRRVQGRLAERVGIGMVLKKKMLGNPRHKCVSVYFPSLGKRYDIAESLLYL